MPSGHPARRDSSGEEERSSLISYRISYAVIRAIAVNCRSIIAWRRVMSVGANHRARIRYPLNERNDGTTRHLAAVSVYNLRVRCAPCRFPLSPYFIIVRDNALCRAKMQNRSAISSYLDGGSRSSR